MSSKATGLSWATLTQNYVEAGGELKPEVWHDYKPPKRQKTPARVAASKQQQVFTVAQEKTILAEYNEGASSLQLSRKYGCQPTTIRKAVKRQGGEIRSRAEAMKISRALKEKS